MIKPGIYQHYKGRFYSVLGMARHSETEELMVLYMPLYLVEEDSSPTQLCVRPLNNFTEIVGTKYRFTRVQNKDEPYKDAIKIPCSACSAGDTKMEFHTHDYVDEKDRRR